MCKNHNNEADSIKIADYDPNWINLANLEIEQLRSVIGDNNLVDIQHIGSTSIPGAMAKPIIDLYISVNSIYEAKKNYILHLVNLGYLYWDENPSPDKLFFVKGMPPYGEQRTHHIHMVLEGSVYWRDRIAFRDYLREYPQDLKSYNQLKLELSYQYRYDRENYTDAKNSFIKGILKKSGIKNGGKR